MEKTPKRKNIFEAFYNKIAKYLAKIFIKTPITPNQITWISGFLGSIGAYL